MKKLIFLLGITLISLFSFGQYTGNKLPSGLTSSATLAASDIMVIQKNGESYVKGITAYHSYLYMRKMLDSITNLTIAGNLTAANAYISGWGTFKNIISTDSVMFMDGATIFDTLRLPITRHYLPSYGYAMVLDTSDYYVKLAPIEPAGRSAYAEIYYADASATQSIPDGATYTKWTAFTNDGEHNNCVADAANDKITITERGIYYVSGSFSSSCGTSGTVSRTTVFLDGVEVDKIHKVTITNSTDAQNGSVSGIIKVTTVPADLDVRVRHDQTGAVSFTGVYGNLSIYKLSEY